MSLFIHRNAGGRCPCGAENATCGPPSNAVPVDQLMEEVPAVSGPLKKYRVTRNGVETLMKLSDDDARRLGVAPEDAVDAVSTIPPVQPVADTVGEDDGGSGVGDGDGGGAAPPADAQPQPQARQAAKAPAKKTAAKRRTPAANKADDPAKDGGASGGDD